MDHVPSLDLISSILLSDFMEENDTGFLNSISFQNSTVCDPTTSAVCDFTTGNITNDGRKRKDSRRFAELEKENGEQSKRIKHRDVERQRRQELATLLKSLRSLLPLQYIKGKRSASDHVQEAVNHIKDLQKKIKELGDKRDEIKRLSELEHRVPNSPPPSSTEECGSSSTCSCSGETTANVVVMPCLAGVEVVISCCSRHKFCLSSVLQVLNQEEGFNVIKCISTKLHGRFIHTIVSQVEEGRQINFSELQGKIMKSNI